MRIRRLSHFGIAFSLIFTVLIMAEAYLGNDGLIRRVPTTHKVIALTFDDGPYPASTPKLLAILREKEVKATMFVLGHHVDENPALFAQMVADGHEIGSHAYHHVYSSKLNAKERVEQFLKTEKAIMSAAPRPVLFRPPGGGYNDAIVQEALNWGYRTVLWSIDPLDWTRPSTDKIVNRVMREIQPGSIVLLHDGEEGLHTAEAVGVIIDRVRAEGYTLVTVGELLQYYEERE